MVLDWIALTVLILAIMVGVALTIIGIGGTFAIVLGALLYNAILWSRAIPLNSVLWLLGLAILGEILEWLITLSSAKRGGSSDLGVAGTIIGAMVGASLLSFLPLIGSVIGFVGGAVLGAFLGEYLTTQDAKRAWKAAKAALLGRVFVSLTKFGLAVVQIVLIVRAL